MAQPNQERGDVYEFSRRQESPAPQERSVRRPPRPRQASAPRSNPWQSTALFCLCILLLGASGLAYYAFMKASALED